MLGTESTQTSRFPFLVTDVFSLAYDVVVEEDEGMRVGEVRRGDERGAIPVLVAVEARHRRMSHHQNLMLKSNEIG